MTLANKKIRIIKREERLSRQRGEEPQAGEPVVLPRREDEGRKRGVAPVIEGWIKEHQRDKEAGRRAAARLSG
jgi:hypothetical protein